MFLWQLPFCTGGGVNALSPGFMVASLCCDIERVVLRISGYGRMLLGLSRYIRSSWIDDVLLETRIICNQDKQYNNISHFSYS
jgi:hypothetical protein